MHYFPVCLDINKKVCVVVGGGQVAERKAMSLVDCGGIVTVISPELTETLKNLYETGKVDWVPRGYEEGDVAGAFLVIAATDDPRTQSMVFEEAEAGNILVNVADVPERCNFILPATVRRGDFSLAVSTGGKSPALARKTRQQLENNFGQEYGVVADILGALRPTVLVRGLSQAENKVIFDKLIDDGLVDLARNHDWDMIESQIRRVLGGEVDLQCLEHIKEKLQDGGLTT